MARTSKRYLTEKLEVTRKCKCYRVALYSRLSVDVEDRKTESIENQIQVMKQYIEAANSDLTMSTEFVIYQTYIDQGKTGTNFAREGFEGMMQAVREGHVNCIMVKDFSRFGRDYIETGNYIEKILPFLGVRFISVGDNYDSMSAVANKNSLTMNIKNLVNEMYAKDISQKVLLSRRVDKENGNYLGRAPYGYQIMNVNGKRTLAIHTESAEVLQWIFEQYAAGDTISQLIQQLYERKVHRITDYIKYGHVFYQAENMECLHQWKRSVIEALLQNSVYIGTLTQGKYKWIIENDKKVRKMIPPEEWIITKHAHQAIIAEELYKSAVTRMNKEKRQFEITEPGKEYEDLREQENLFANVLYCGDCGKKLRTRYYESKVHGRRNYSYFCQNAFYMDDRKCKNKIIYESELKEIFLESIKKELEKHNLKGRKLNVLTKECIEELCVPYKAEQKQIEKQQNIWRRKAAQMYQEYKEAHLSIEDYENFRMNRNMNEQYFQRRLEEIQLKMKELELQVQENRIYIKSLLEYDYTKHISRDLVESLVRKFKLYEDGIVEIEYKFTGGKDNGN